MPRHYHNKRLDRTIKALRDAGYWPLKMSLDRRDEHDPEITLPDGRSVSLCQRGGYMIVVPRKDGSFGIGEAGTIPTLLKNLSGKARRDYNKIHFAIHGKSICRSNRHHYAGPSVTTLRGAVTCKSCLRQLECADEARKAGPSRKQKADEVVPRPQMSGVLPDTE